MKKATAGCFVLMALAAACAGPAGLESPPSDTAASASVERPARDAQEPALTRRRKE